MRYRQWYLLQQITVAVQNTCQPIACRRYGNGLYTYTGSNPVPAIIRVSPLSSCIHTYPYPGIYSAFGSGKQRIQRLVN